MSESEPNEHEKQKPTLHAFRRWLADHREAMEAKLDQYLTTEEPGEPEEPCGTESDLFLASLEALLSYENALALAQSNYDEAELLAAAAWLTYQECLANS